MTQVSQRAGPRRARRGARSRRAARDVVGARHGRRASWSRAATSASRSRSSRARPRAKEPLRQAGEQAVLALPGVTSVTAVLTAERAPGGARRRAEPAARWRAARRRPAPAAPAAAKPALPGRARDRRGRLGQGRRRQVDHRGQPRARRSPAHGQRVGLLDADIYGPSQPRMLGITGKPAAPTARSCGRWRTTASG